MTYIAEDSGDKILEGKISQILLGSYFHLMSEVAPYTNLVLNLSLSNFSLAFRSILQRNLISENEQCFSVNSSLPEPLFSFVLLKGGSYYP